MGPQDILERRYRVRRHKSKPNKRETRGGVTLHPIYKTLAFVQKNGRFAEPMCVASSDA
jgi:hypothetical protein